MAVVLPDRAALFVDGRYTAQAANEVDQQLIAIRHVVEQPMTEWLATLPSKAGSATTLGCTRQTRPLLSTGVRQSTGPGGAVDGNLVDQLADQPPPPIAPIVPHNPAFAGSRP